MGAFENRRREIVVEPGRPRRARAVADEFGEDLVERALAGRGPDIVGRQQVLAALIRVCSKLFKKNACLVGPPGVGKTAIVEGLAVEVAEGRVPKPLRGVSIVSVNLSLLSAGCGVRNQFEGRVKSLLERARHNPDMILFLDEFHTIASPGNDISQMLKADLGRGTLRCIGATTSQEWRACIEPDGALVRRVQVIPVAPLPRPETLEVLRRLLPRMGEHHGVQASEPLLEEICYRAERYLPRRPLLDACIDLLDESLAEEAASLVSATGSKASRPAGRCGPAPARDDAGEEEDLEAAIDAAIDRGDFSLAQRLDAGRVRRTRP